MLTFCRRNQRVRKGEWSAEINPCTTPRTPLADITGTGSVLFNVQEAVFRSPGPRRTIRAKRQSNRQTSYGDRNLFCACPPIEATKSDVRQAAMLRPDVFLPVSCLCSFLYPGDLSRHRASDLCFSSKNFKMGGAPGFLKKKGVPPPPKKNPGKKKKKKKSNCSEH